MHTTSSIMATKSPGIELEVEAFLYGLGVELKKTKAQMDPIVEKIVRDNWLDTMDSLRDLTDSQWAALQLPLRLVEEIRKRVQKPLVENVESPSKTSAEKAWLSTGGNNAEYPYVGANADVSAVSSVSNWSTLTHLGSCTGEEALNRIVGDATDPQVKGPGGVNYADSYASQEVNFSSPSNTPGSPPASPASFMWSSRTNGEQNEGPQVFLTPAPHRKDRLCGPHGRDLSEAMISSRIARFAVPPPKSVHNMDDLSTMSVCDSTASGPRISDVTDSLSQPGSLSAGPVASNLEQVQFEARDDDIFEACLATSVEQLKSDIPRETLKEEVLPTLFKIVDAVLADPKNSTRRRLRSANEKFTIRVGSHPSAVEILRAVGFQESDGCWLLPIAYIARLTDCHHLLAEVARSLDIAAPSLPHNGFNPYRSNVSSLTNAGMYSQAGDYVEDSVKIRKAIKEREALLRQGDTDAPIPLQPRVFHSNDIHRLEDAISTLSDVPPNQLNSTATEILASCESLTEGAKFQMRAKKELDHLCRRKIYPKCIIRVKFPDQLILEMCLRPSDTVQRLNELLATCLSPAILEQKWYVFLSPPLRLLHTKKTLFDEDLVPGAVLHFKVEGKVGEASNGVLGSGQDTAAKVRFLTEELMGEYEKSAAALKRKKEKEERLAAVADAERLMRLKEEKVKSKSSKKSGSKSKGVCDETSK